MASAIEQLVASLAQQSAATASGPAFKAVNSKPVFKSAKDVPGADMDKVQLPRNPMLTDGFGKERSPEAIAMLRKMLNSYKAENGETPAPSDAGVAPNELETVAPTRTAPTPRPVMGGGVAGPQMLERDLLGPTQKAALHGYRQSEQEYAKHWADPYLAMQQQEEALQRAAIEEQKAVANVQAKAEAERAGELAERQEQFDNSVRELSQMKIDPGRAMKNSNPLQFVFGAIAAMIGGAQSARTGGPNQGLEMIDKWIDRDIEAQKFQYQAKKDGVAAQQTAFGQAMQRFGDMRQAEAIARASLKERLGMEAMNMASKTKRADLMDRAAQMQVQMRKSAFEDAKNFISYGAVGGSGAPKDESTIFDEDKVSGGNLLFNDAKSRERFETSAESAAAARTLVERIKANRDKLLSFSGTPAEKYRLIEQLNADKTGLGGAIKKQGENSDLDAAKNLQRIGSPLNPFADTRQMDAIVSDMQRAADRVAQQGGAQQIAATRTVDKKSHKVQLRGALGGKYEPTADQRERLQAIANKYKESK